MDSYYSGGISSYIDLKSIPLLRITSFVARKITRENTITETMIICAVGSAAMASSGIVK